MKTVMQEAPVKLLDVLALLEDKPEERLFSGHVGTVVEVVALDVFEVEFLDPQGRTVALAELKRPELLVLRHDSAQAR